MISSSMYIGTDNFPHLSQFCPPAKRWDRNPFRLNQMAVNLSKIKIHGQMDISIHRKEEEMLH